MFTINLYYPNINLIFHLNSQHNERSINTYIERQAISFNY